MTGGPRYTMDEYERLVQEGRAEAVESPAADEEDDEVEGEPEPGEPEPGEPEPEALVEIPPEDPHAYACPTCQGWGIVRTGSRVEAYLVRSCQDCMGLGYKERAPEPLPTYEPLAPAPVLSAGFYTR